MEFAREAQETEPTSLRRRQGGRGEAEGVRRGYRVSVLNVAGPRASKEPGVGDFVMRTLQAAFGQITRMDQGC